MTIRKPSFQTVTISGALALAGISGYFTANALGTSSQAPQTTTTITLTDGATGATGPAGATGPQGPPGKDGDPGAENCPTGSVFGELVINHPGGHVTIWTCIKNGTP